MLMVFAAAGACGPNMACYRHTMSRSSDSLPHCVDSEGSLVLGAVLSHVVQYQLSLVRPANSLHHECPGSPVCSIEAERLVHLIVHRASRNLCFNGLERGVREVA